ncbi:Sec1-like protein [Mucor mucedo]|uniref:Sec1-like protein n=1 Tax=Mucor mucedo TaxID=29922 RepID=UPI00221EC8F0|nr:Sec1-like protein [Mucor mucedo]KAI7892453.1 Sec1-like protein [Mucor mucedo]
MYAAAHVHFINGLENNTFNEFTRLLNAANASNDIRSLKEMYVDFLVRENCVYTLDDQRKFLGLFANSDESSPAQIESQLEDIAKQHLTRLVQAELDAFCATNPEFPPPRDPALPSGTLIILDRTIDHISPFLHEFTYQAMVADLLQVEEIPAGLKYEYKYTQEDGTTQDQEVTLIETDPVYTAIRHMHIASTTEKLIDDFNAFLNENKISSGGGPTTAVSLNDMKNMIGNLPQYQEMKTRFSAHMNIAAACMTEFKDQNLETIGLLEQDMACGETPDGEQPTNLVESLLPILDDPFTSNMVKTRLILLWIATSDTVDPEDLESLLSVARLDQEFKDAIENITLLGVQLSKSANRQGQKTKKGKKKKNIQQEVPFDLSRYVPVVKRIVQGHIDNTIDQSLFPNYTSKNVRQKSLRRDPSEVVKEVPKLRVYKTQWHKKSTGANAAPKPPSGPPIIIFIVGGMTYSEIRSAYEIAETFDREVYIGSTHIITPDKFVEDLGKLDKVLPPPKSVVPVYTGSIHATTKKTTEKILPPRTTSTVPASNSSKPYNLFKKN